MKLYFKYMSILLKSQLQYRTSFLLLAFGQFFIPFFVFAGLYFMFDRFGQIRGWSFYEVALCFSVIHMAFSLSECFARGFDTFSGMVVNGEFDRVLVRPRSTVVQVLGSKFEFSRVGRLLQSVIVMAYAIWMLPLAWTPAKVLLLVMMVVSGICIFISIYMIAAALCFWTIQGLEVVNIFTDGGREMSQYPINIYHKQIARFFTYVIPFGCANYLPLKVLLDRTSETDNILLHSLAPLWGMAFLLPALYIWKLGVRHYRSTGS